MYFDFDTDMEYLVSKEDLQVVFNFVAQEIVMAMWCFCHRAADVSLVASSD